MDRNRIVVIAAGVVVAAIAGWWFLMPAGPRFADNNDASLVALGRDVYAAECAACHGANLEGQPNWRSPLPTGGFPAPPHDESGHTWHHADSLLFAITRDGGPLGAPAGRKSNMLLFGGKLSDREIWASLAYIKSRWPERIRQRQAKLNRRDR